ncbi:MAG: hypothetical protein J6328_06530, partial [Bacilli bacterium]|nr:hypothetical protein [Bacilli bacterium]
MKNKSSILLLSAALLLASCNTISTSSSHQGSTNPISSLPGDSASSTLPSSSIPARASLKGEGTEENPYLIEEALDLNLMAALSEKGSEAITSYFSLTRDIDCAGAKISQISKANPFSGHFFGNGHSIKNLSVPYSTIRIGTNRVVIAGLFGYLEDAIVT